MKRLLLFCVALGMAATLQAQWTAVGPVGFSPSSAEMTRMAIDLSGTPYIAFADNAQGLKATVMKYNGAGWVTVGNTGFSVSPVGNRLSLALDGSGTPWIACVDYSLGGKITVMKYDGTAWITVGSQGISAAGGDFPSLAMDANGTPYVAYQDADGTNGNSYGLTVMKYDGSAWQTVGNATFSTGGVEQPSLAIDHTGTPYVAYQNSNPDLTITVMKYNGANWAPVGGAGISADPEQQPSLAIDGSGTPYVACKHLGSDINYNKILVRKYDGASWVQVGSTSVSSNGGSNPSLAVNSNDTPCVAFEEGTNGIVARKYNGTGWSLVGSGYVSAGLAYTPSLAIDNSDNAYIAFQDGVNSNKASVMRYDATSAINDLAGNAHTPLLLLQNYPNPFSDRTVISYELNKPGDVTLDVYDMQGRDVMALALHEQQAGAHSCSLKAEANQLPAGTYVYQITSTNKDGVYKRRKLMTVAE